MKQNIIIIDENMNQLKGNLHVHSNMSDGKYSVEEVIKKYSDEGYNFLAITDHNKKFTGQLKSNKLVLIPGIEISCDYIGDEENLIGTYVHFNLFFDNNTEDELFKIYKYSNQNQLQKILDDIKRYNTLIQFNHPFISRLTEDKILNLDGYDFIEIYNTKDFIEEVGIDSFDGIILSMLRRNKKVMITANDDYHGEYNLDIDRMYRKTFEIVQGENNIDNILKRIKEGYFYSSTGPKIYDYRIENEILKIKTDAVKYIVFYTNLRHCKRIYNIENTVNYGEYYLSGEEKFVWAVITDENGNKAWTQPYWI